MALDRYEPSATRSDVLGLKGAEAHRLRSEPRPVPFFEDEARVAVMASGKRRAGFTDGEQIPSFNYSDIEHLDPSKVKPRNPHVLGHHRCKDPNH
jgi:hypothetical protein